MAEDNDFVALYDELGIGSECSVVEFRSAYRRRVAMLHPDHPGHSADISRLQRLNRLYAAAIEFHRLRGRLPGSTRPRPRPRGHEASPVRRVPPPESRSPEKSMTGPSYKPRYLLVAALALVALYWLGASRTTSPRLDPQGSADGPAKDISAQGVPRVALGMPPALVRQILGRPLREEEHRWHYGPSWVDFSCGKVVDWYSSPLHPLRVEHQALDGERSSAMHMLHRC